MTHRNGRIVKRVIGQAEAVHWIPPHELEHEASPAHHQSVGHRCRPGARPGVHKGGGQLLLRGDKAGAAELVVGRGTHHDHRLAGVRGFNAGR